MCSLPALGVSTPVGGAGLGAAVSQIAMYFVGLIPAYQHLPGQVQGAVSVIVSFFLAYLGGWFMVTRADGQKVTLELTPQKVPTVQATDPPPDLT